MVQLYDRSWSAVQVATQFQGQNSSHELAALSISEPIERVVDRVGERDTRTHHGHTGDGAGWLCKWQWAAPDSQSVRAWCRPCQGDHCQGGEPHQTVAECCCAGRYDVVLLSSSVKILEILLHLTKLYCYKFQVKLLWIKTKLLVFTTKKTEMQAKVELAAT